MTAMGMIALAPYSKQAKVKKALDRAISYLLSEKRMKPEALHSGAPINLESCAQAICGLLAWGEPEYGQAVL